MAWSRIIGSKRFATIDATTNAPMVARTRIAAVPASQYFLVSVTPKLPSLWMVLRTDCFLKLTSRVAWKNRFLYGYGLANGGLGSAVPRSSVSFRQGCVKCKSETEAGLAALRLTALALGVLAKDGIHVVSDAVAALLAGGANSIQPSDEGVVAG